MAKAAIHKSTFAVPCDTYGCLNRSEYYVGRDDGPRNISHNLCKECAENLIANLPTELKGILPDPAAGIDITPDEINGIPPENTPVPILDDAEDAEGDFECSQCGKSFKTERGLNIHISQAHKE